MELNLENESLFYQTLQKRLNIDHKLMKFIYIKCKDAMDKMKKIFKSPLYPNSSKDLNIIRSILKKGPMKESNYLNIFKIMKNENSKLFRNNSFNLVNSLKYKKYVDKILFLKEENKISNDLNNSH